MTSATTFDQAQTLAAYAEANDSEGLAAWAHGVDWHPAGQVERRGRTAAHQVRGNEAPGRDMLPMVVIESASTHTAIAERVIDTVLWAAARLLVAPDTALAQLTIKGLSEIVVDYLPGQATSLLIDSLWDPGHPGSVAGFGDSMFDVHVVKVELLSRTGVTVSPTA